MRQAITGVVGLCLAASLFCSDALAQRGRFGGARGRAAGGLTARPGGRGPAISANPAARITNAGVGRQAVGPRLTTPGRRSGNAPKLGTLGQGALANPKLPAAAGAAWNRLSAQGQRLSTSAAANRVRQVLGTTPGQTAAAALGLTAAARPFSPAWYTAHPNVFRITHPHADAVAVATVAGLTRWLGVPCAYPAVAGSGDTSTVVATESYVPSTEPATESSAAETYPTTTAAEGATAPPADWTEIGVFEIRPDAPTPATRLLHLALGRDGTIRGSHYDLVSEQVQDVQGQVNTSTLRAAWTVGSQGNVVFETSLEALTQAEGQLTVHFPDGKTALWRITRRSN